MEDPHISILDPGYFMAQIKRPGHQMIDITERKKKNNAISVGILESASRKPAARLKAECKQAWMHMHAG